MAHISRKPLLGFVGNSIELAAHRRNLQDNASAWVLLVRSSGKKGKTHRISEAYTLTTRQAAKSPMTPTMRYQKTRASSMLSVWKPLDEWECPPMSMSMSIFAIVATAQVRASVAKVVSRRS